MRVPMVGLIIAIAVLGFLAIKPATLPLAGFALLLVVLGAALGPMYPTSTIIMQNAVKPYQMGIATGTLNFFRLLGGAIIVAAFGAIVFGSAGGHGGDHANDAGRAKRILLRRFAGCSRLPRSSLPSRSLLLL